MVDFRLSFSFNNDNLKKLQQKVKALHGQRQIPLPELLPDDFIRKYTDFQTLQEMVDASGIEKVEEIGNKEFSKFVSTHTQFITWEEMQKAAGIEYTKRQLGF